MLREGPVTAWQLAGRLRRSGTLEGCGLSAACDGLRALVILAHLRRLGRAQEVPGPPPHWTATARLQRRGPGVFPG
ncbi:hypothetical protein [Streptomyces rapamycinicus]|uniref:hypothetical protein n=1 Tax=Streptomyces rapamycinicus TaxID=1226757 RepID=UPI0020C989A6|nr:hypothetical protein [Streptomyces rapamycinicus]UTP36739.1 hypothetical protein LIV37_50300 [Streptomyces rapamycinicus NRRL 5491]